MHAAGGDRKTIARPRRERLTTPGMAVDGVGLVDCAVRVRHGAGIRPYARHSMPAQQDRAPSLRGYHSRSELCRSAIGHNARPQLDRAPGVCKPGSSSSMYCMQARKAISIWRACRMSAFGPKRTWGRASRNVRFRGQSGHRNLRASRPLLTRSGHWRTALFGVFLACCRLIRVQDHSEGKAMARSQHAGELLHGSRS